MFNRCSTSKKIFYLLISFLTILVVIAVTKLDISIARLFYNPGFDPPWPHHKDYLWHSLYHYGVYLPLALGAVAFLLFIGGFFSLKLKPLKRKCLFAVLLLLIGPGLIIQTLKNTWGRPRPGEIKEFGGIYQFQTPFEPNFKLIGNKNDGKSFPSGHSSMGFYLIFLYFILRKKTALLFGSFYGGLMGLGRMIQGGHFFSDILASFFIIYLLGEVLSKLLLKSEVS